MTVVACLTLHRKATAFWTKMEFKRILAFIFLATWLSSSEAYVVKKSWKFDFPKHLIGTNKSDSHELDPLARKYNAVDLGMDTLDGEAPMHLRNALVNATLSDDNTLNQYSDPDGIPRLRNAIAQLYSKLLNHHVDPESDVVVTLGATEAVYLAFNGHTSPGDEWIVIQPAYTMYLPMIQTARGVPRFTTLKQKKKGDEISGNDWELDKEEMEKLFNKRTKGILLNNPLNPLGKVYTLDELTFIADMAKKYDTIVVSDEAHEMITFQPHIRIASLPGMYERTISIGSASKSFSVSGWRLGWAIAPPSILNHLKTLHKRTVDSPPTPSQDALAYGFEQEIKNFGKPESYFAQHLEHVGELRDIMVQAFRDAGMTPVVPEGGYCMIAQWTSLKSESWRKPVKGAAMEFAKRLIKNVGILGLPFTGFYDEQFKHLGEEHMRYCFHKKDETIQRTLKALQKLKELQ